MLPTIENAKNRFWSPESHPEQALEYIPHLYLEAKIDFSDVRTGFRESYSVNRAVEIPSSEMDPFWDDEAVQDINPDKLRADVPEKVHFSSLPEYVDKQFMSRMETKFIQYLLRAFTVRIYRNFYLDEYSFSGESRNDFIIRCLDLNKGPMHREFDTLLGVFKRKLERIQQKYLEAESSEELEELKTDSRNRELFNRISERISALFLHTEFSIQRVTRPSDTIARMYELDEKLQSLHFEAQEAVSKILDAYEEKAKSVDEYILHPTVKNIHFVSSYVLWIPEGAF